MIGVLCLPFYEFCDDEGSRGNHGVGGRGLNRGREDSDFTLVGSTRDRQLR